MTVSELRSCPICGATPQTVGSKTGGFRKRSYALGRCSCGAGMVLDPDVDYDALYDERYYRGLGADPLVDYMYEFEHPDRTVRAYEWTGILQIVRRVHPVSAGSRWVDFGSGIGGLVTFLRRMDVEAYGFDQGYGSARAIDAGVPMLDSAALERMAGTVDVVSAVEVLEHLIDPHPILAQVSRLLRPGGIFFYTTGNAGRVRDLERWGYVVPEVHITFYTPNVMTKLLEENGLEPIHVPYGSGHDVLIRFKVLKNLHFRNRSWLESLLPWRPIGAVLDRLYGITDMPLARKR